MNMIIYAVIGVAVLVLAGGFVGAVLQYWYISIPAAIAIFFGLKTFHDQKNKRNQV